MGVRKAERRHLGARRRLGGPQRLAAQSGVVGREQTRERGGWQLAGGNGALGRRVTGDRLPSDA